MGGEKTDNNRPSLAGFIPLWCLVFIGI